jgi:hypothetical protein
MWQPKDKDKKTRIQFEISFVMRKRESIISSFHKELGSLKFPHAVSKSFLSVIPDISVETMDMVS